MGGYGSGSWQRYEAKTLVEHTIRLSIFDLHKHGVECGKVCSGSGTGPNGFTLRFTLAKDTLTLSYMADNQRHVIAVPIVATRPNYGGSRSWFLCPSCSRRCAVLYIHADNTRFACRVCQELQYQSTRIVSEKEQFEYMARLVKSFDARMARRQELVNRILEKERS